MRSVSLPAPAPRRHFASLEALRFFAFLKVFFFHVPITLAWPWLLYLKRGGGIGVEFFFVLSGFLITYLLVADKQAHGQIDVRSFLVRRSLRIWPLFYAGVLLAFLLPDALAEHWGFHTVAGGYVPDWRFSFTFLENYKMLLTDNFPRTTPLPVFWSLCIEEHFYLVWVAALFVVPRPSIRTFLLLCLPLAWACRYLEPFVFPQNHAMETNDLLTHLDVFAIGGLLGHWVARDYAGFSARVNGLRLGWRYGIVVGVVLAVVFQVEVLPYVPGSGFNVVRSTVVATLFAALIAMFLPANSAIGFRSPVLAYLGRISYGLYVFHIIAIHTTLQYCTNHGIFIDTVGENVLLTVGIFGATVAMSSLSFHYFETPFLRLRDRLTRPQLPQPRLTVPG